MIEKRVLIAFGGNALIKATEKGTISEQIKNAEEAAENLAPLLLEYKNVVIVHGNGPQVGQNLIRVEEGVTKVPPLPLDVCVAETQGSMGFIIEKGFQGGGDKLREAGYNVHSLAIIDSLDNCEISFR